VKGRVGNFIQDLDWGNLIAGAVVGAVVGLILTSLAAPALNPHVTRFYEDSGWYSAPPVSVEIQDTGEYHPVNSSVEDFDGLTWKSEFSVYRVKIQNTGNKPVSQLEFMWRAPGCVVYSNTDGPTAGGQFSLTNRGTYGISSNVPMTIDRYQCTKVIEVVNGELSPGESLAAEFVVKSKFDKCDVLIDLNPRNLHSLNYTWKKNGVRFDEERTLRPSHLQKTYQQAQNTTFVGTQESLKMSSGEYIHSFVVGVRGDNLSQAMERCVNSSEQ